MKRHLTPFLVALLAALVLWAAPSGAVVQVQCPGDSDGDAVPETPVPGRDIKCMHLTAGDGFITVAGDGYLLDPGDPTSLTNSIYMFGFADMTGKPAADVLSDGILAQTFSAPPIELDQGQEFYLTLTNVGMIKRPDLFDPHTVHYHGLPESSNIFDGLPESGIAIGMNASLTYYYLNNEPGTYMYHCHVEATEHMQMGMLGSLHVHAGQDGELIGGFNRFAYNDTDGTTGYHREFTLQLGSFDSYYHGAHQRVQPLPFALMRDDYPMINGRGYPETVAAAAPPAPPEVTEVNPGITTTQPRDALVTANAGETVLLRISNLAVTRFYTLASLNFPLKVVGTDARILRGRGDAAGKDLYYQTNSVTLGGGMAADATFVAPAYVGPGAYDKYFLYAGELNFLTNGDDDALGGMLTEVRVYPAGTLPAQIAQ